MSHMQTKGWHNDVTDEQIMAISEENGYNKNAMDGSLKNDAGVDWFKFQEALGKLGYMGIIDIEGPTGGVKVDAADTMFVQNSDTVGGIKMPKLTTVALIGIMVFAFSRMFAGKSVLPFMVEEGFDAEFESPHFWK